MTRSKEDRLPLYRIIALSAAALLLAACTALPAVQAQPEGTATPVTPAPADNTPSPVDNVRVITRADNGKTITLRVGERFLLNLGEGYDWTVTIADQSIVSRVPGILVVRGAQGVYEARQAGTTTLSASGDPPCRQSRPPCAMPSLMFQVQLVVQ